MEKPRFIRKNGRIIPIFSKDPKKDKGAKQIAAGAVVAGGGGLIAGIKIRKADSMHQQVFDFFEEKKGVKLPKGVQSIEQGFHKANMKLRFSKRLAFGARLAASALVFTGIANVLHDEKDSDLKSMVKVGGAAVASELVSRGIYAGFKKKIPFSMPISPATKKAGLDIFNRLIKGAAL